MLWTIVIALLLLWAIGLGLAGPNVVGYIHVLLVAAVILMLGEMVYRRRV